MNFTHATQTTQNLVIDSSGIDITTQAGAVTTLRDGKVGIGTSNPGRVLEVEAPNPEHDGTGLRIRYNSTHYTDYRTNGLEVNPSNQQFNISQAGTERFRIHNNGNVGIGTNTPACPLHVNGNTEPTNYSGDRILKQDLGAWPGTSNIAYEYPTSARFSDYVHIESGGGLILSSDSRIKTNICEYSDVSALNLVNQIECKEYHYTDPLRRNYNKTIGYIAQQVREVFPNAASIHKDVVPANHGVLLAQVAYLLQ